MTLKGVVCTIGGTVNIGNFENTKIEIQGKCNTAGDVEELKEYFRDIIGTLGGDEATRAIFARWGRRVLGGGPEE